jgi:hypothetical protein
MQDNGYSLPFYIGLKSKGRDYHFNITQYFEECFIDDLDKEKYPFLKLDSIKPYFYLDGFDEISERITNTKLSDISNSSIMKRPFLLTCRNQYAQRYIQSLEFVDKISIRISIIPRSIAKAKQYIATFCTIQKRENLIPDINGLLTDNTELNEILDNPLLITMLLWIIEKNGMRVPETIKSRVHLFREYIEELAHRELERQNIKTVSSEKLIQIWSLASWEIYYAKLRGSSIRFLYCVKICVSTLRISQTSAVHLGLKHCLLVTGTISTVPFMSSFWNIFRQMLFFMHVLLPGIHIQTF